jgi:hypothetical protein
VRGAPFRKEISKVKKTIFAMAVLALAATVPASALNTSSIPSTTQATFNLAQAYPCEVLPIPNKPGVSPLMTWCGAVGTSRPLETDFPGAAPGILSLKRSGNFLDVNCFAVPPTNPEDSGTGPVRRYECTIQAYRLIKEVPGSFKCPDVYGLPHFDDKGNLIPYRYFQYGTGVRTWWSLNFTQPGTKFILEVVSACRLVTRTRVTEGVGTIIDLGNTAVQKDVWVWRVVANPRTLLNLINMMHGGAVATLEVPCILGEDMYVALLKANAALLNAVEVTKTPESIGNAIFDMEALIVANCLFVEVLNPLVAFPGPPQFGAPNILPPGNLAQTVFFGQGSAVAGIIDTVENPCCCKLLVDLEWIALRNGLVGQTPTLPTF